MSSESPAAVIVDSAGIEVNVLDDAGVKRLASDARVDSDPHSRREVDIYSATFQKVGVAADTFFMLVDLNGASYPHTAGSKASIVSVFGRAFKSSAGAKWAVNAGVITRIDGTDADITFFPAASMFLRDTASLTAEAKATILDFPVSTEISGGDLARGVSNFHENPVAAVNTGVTLEDPNGDNPTPAVGDIVIRAELISGAGTLDFALGVQYFVET
jgi:hypothetical protein